MTGKMFSLVTPILPCLLIESVVILCDRYTCYQVSKSKGDATRSLCANMSGFCLGWVSDVRKKDEFAALIDENYPVASMEVRPLRLADTPSS